MEEIEISKVEKDDLILELAKKGVEYPAKKADELWNELTDGNKEFLTQHMLQRSATSHLSLVETILRAQKIPFNIAWIYKGLQAQLAAWVFRVSHERNTVVITVKNEKFLCGLFSAHKHDTQEVLDALHFIYDRQVGVMNVNHKEEGEKLITTIRITEK